MSKGGPELAVSSIPGPFFLSGDEKAGRKIATPVSRPPGSGSKNRKVSLLAVTGISCGPEVISPERGKAPGARGGGKDYCSPRWATASASCAGSSAGAAAALGSTPSFLPPSGKFRVSQQPGSALGCLERAIQGHRDRLESVLGPLREPHGGAETGWGLRWRPWERFIVGAGTSRQFAAFLGRAEALKET